MTDTPDRPREVLVLEGRPGSMRALADGLRNSGLLVDVTHDLREVRDAFFRRGGHDLIVIGPDLPDALSRATAETLGAIDDAVQIVVFGDRLPDTRRATRVTAFHPGSRAALGAVLRQILPIPGSRA